MGDLPRGNGNGGGMEAKSALLGALIAAVLIGMAWFALPYFQQKEQAPEAQAQPVQLIASSRLPTDFQIVVKNNHQQPVRIEGLEIGGRKYDLAANLSPGEIRAFSLVPPDCSQQQEYNCNVIIYYLSGGNAVSTASQNATGEGTPTPESSQQGGTQQQNGSSQGGAGTAPLSIDTTALNPGTRDIRYGFSLEASGGSGSYYWSVSGLPSALTATSNGRISGQALQPGSFTLHVVVSDGTASTARDLQLVVNENPG